MSVCAECDRLQQDEARRLRLYQEQLQIDRELRVNNIQFARLCEERLLETYELAAAKRRIHEAKKHPGSGHEVALEDLNILILKGKTTP